MKSCIKKVCLVLSAVMALGVMGCNSSVDKEKPETEITLNRVKFSITLPGKAARAVYTQDDAAMYEVIVTMDNEPVAEKKGKPGDTLSFEFEKEGSYKIVVKAYDAEDILIAEGQVEMPLAFSTETISIKVNLTPKEKPGKIDVEVEPVWPVKSDFVKINAGTFQMGSNQGFGDNKPVHTVIISKAFYMCDHEVTQAEYEAVMGEGSNPSFFKNGADEGEVQENRPVEQVSWYMAIVYCNKRSIKEGLTPCYTISGKTDPAEWGTIQTSSDETWNAVECNWTANGYRLPTEAEWEYAARAGDNTVDALTWSGINAETSLGDYAWYSSNAGLKTHEVKKKSENAKKLYDMSGNVWEWCWDWWPAKGDYSEAATTDPRGDTSGSLHVRRGGSYNDGSGLCAVSCRDFSSPYIQDYIVGFRVCRNAN